VEIARPTTVDAALRAIDEDPSVTVLAGGTDLMVEVNLHHLRPASVVALRRIDELRQLRSTWIGAGATYAQLEAAQTHRGLTELARTVGSPQIRAVGTVGGNLATASPAGDTLPFFAAMGATVVLVSSEGERRVPWAEFLVGRKRTAIRPGELILGVEVAEPDGIRSAFAKVGVRRSMVIATVNCCVVRHEDGTTAVALGAVGPTVLRAPQAEALVSGDPAPTSATLDEFQRLVAQEVAPITDHRSTADYRRHAVAVLARRTLERCL
jgi:CO/xanthine dehydrogenase FAD-binding subunit